MKTKVRSTVLVSLFIAFLVSVFLIFVIVRNNSSPVLANILLLIIMTIGALLFVLSMQLLNQTKKQGTNSEQNQVTLENITQELAEVDIEKRSDIEIDPKKIIPKEKMKLEAFSEELLRNLANDLPVVQALIFVKSPIDDLFKCTGKFAYYSDENPADFKIGETLSGQALKNKTIVTLANIPENYMIIASGLGNGKPGYLTYIPLIFHEEAVGLIEFATFTPIAGSVSKSLGQLSEKIADSISKFIKK